MEQKTDLSFRKSERLCSKRLIEALFAGGNKSMSAFPLRVVFMPVQEKDMAAPASILVSVSKRRFKKAVKRNRVKRQIREAYRKNKHILTVPLEAQGRKLALAFLWLSDRLYPSNEVEQCVRRLLVRISETLSSIPQSPVPDEHAV